MPQAMRGRLRKRRCIGTFCPVWRRVTSPPPDPKLHPIAQAYRWISIVVTSVILMVLPGIGGGWLDRRFGTRFFALGGVVLGLVTGIYYLLVSLPKPPSKRGRGPGSTEGS